MKRKYIKGDDTNLVPLQRLEVKNMFYGALPIHFEIAKKLRNNQTEAENYLWNYLSNLQKNGLRFKRQHPILYFIADFYCHKAKLIIEVDGCYHDTPEQFEYDQNRDAELEALGLKVIRFTNNDVFTEIASTIEIIEKEIQSRTNHVCS